MVVYMHPYPYRECREDVSDRRSAQVHKGNTVVKNININIQRADFN